MSLGDKSAPQLRWKSSKSTSSYRVKKGTRRRSKPRVGAIQATGENEPSYRRRYRERFGILTADGEVCRCSHLDYVEGRPGVICAVCDRTASTASPWEPSWERATTTAVEQWRSPPVEADHMVAHLVMDLQVSATAKKGDEVWVECPHGSVRVRGHAAAPEGFYSQ